MQQKVKDIQYTLVRKSVKNINLRITREGDVHVSANRRVPLPRIEQFILSKREWILSASERLKKSAQAEGEVLYTKEQVLAAFMPYIKEVFPLFTDILDEKMPIIKVRLMKTRWGVCNITKKTITLNMRLIEKPIESLEYVIMHEFVHFIVHDHSAEFYAVLSRYMPDYKQRKALLK